MQAEQKDDSYFELLFEPTPEIIAQILLESRRRMIDEYSNATFQEFIGMGDYGIRCGIAAILFLASQYSNATYAMASGQSEKVVKGALPSATDLKNHVANYFAGWLIRPLATRPRPGMAATADDIDSLANHYDLLVTDWVDAAALCAVKLNAIALNMQKTWRDEVKRCYPYFPDDLIERLPPKHKWENVPEEMRKRRDVTAKPKEIALLPAARLCGDHDNSLELSTLKKYLQQQKGGRWKKKGK